MESGTSSVAIASRGFVGYANDPSFPAGGQDRSYIVYGGTPAMYYLDGTPQKNLRNRVSQTYNDAGARTYYSYDEHGNLSWLSQEIPGFPVAR